MCDMDGWTTEEWMRTLLGLGNRVSDAVCGTCEGVLGEFVLVAVDSERLILAVCCLSG